MTDRPVTVREGQIYWRGVYRLPEEAERMAAQFETVTDYFRPTAHRYARQLRAALHQIQPREKAA